MKYILFTILGMFLMYVLLRILSSKTVSSSGDTTSKLTALLRTQECANLLKTNEAKELIKTPEFKNLIKTVADDALISISQSLTGYEPKL